MDLSHLRALLALARHGTVTAAATSLGYSQPAVSQQLAALEAEVGTPLTTRVGRRLGLTAAGRTLAARAEEILGQVESARREIAAQAGLRSGLVRVAGFPSALATLVPRAVGRFRAAHPDVEVALTEAEPPDALALLRGGRVDAALVFGHDAPDGAAGAPPRSDVTLRPLLDDPTYLVVPDSAPAGSGLAGHRDARWIAGCERCRTHLVRSCADAGFAPTIAFETDDYVAVQALVAAGVGVSTLPGLALEAVRLPGVRAEPLAGDVRRVALATFGGPRLPASTEAFAAVLDDAAQQSAARLHR